jgi:hypothetical protein
MSGFRYGAGITFCALIILWMWGGGVGALIGSWIVSSSQKRQLLQI